MLVRKTAVTGCLLAAILTGGTIAPAEAVDKKTTTITDDHARTAAGTDGGAPQGDSSGGCFQADGTPLPCVNPAGGVWNGSCYELVWARTPEEAVEDYTEQGWDGQHEPQSGQVDWWKRLAPAGATNGVIIDCALPGAASGTKFWRQSAEPPPSVADLEAAVRLMLVSRIVAPEIGAWPPAMNSTDPEVVDPLGWPVWFWAENPGEGIAAPLTQSTTVGGYTLRATARLVDIVYDTGDGRSVTCGLGVEPAGRQRSEPAARPPACGHVFDERGCYTVTATTHVVVDWSAAGRGGSIPVTVDRSGSYAVAEIQVLIVPSGAPPPRPAQRGPACP